MSRTKIAQYYYNLGRQKAAQDMLGGRTKTAAPSAKELRQLAALGGAGLLGAGAGVAGSNYKALAEAASKVPGALSESAAKVPGLLSDAGANLKYMVGGAPMANDEVYRTLLRMQNSPEYVLRMSPEAQALAIRKFEDTLSPMQLKRVKEMITEVPSGGNSMLDDALDSIAELPSRFNNLVGFGG
jgi:hypothetical protein